MKRNLTTNNGIHRQMTKNNNIQRREATLDEAQRQQILNEEIDLFCKKMSKLGYRGMVFMHDKSGYFVNKCSIIGPTRTKKEATAVGLRYCRHAAAMFKNTE